MIPCLRRLSVNATASSSSSSSRLLAQYRCHLHGSGPRQSFATAAAAFTPSEELDTFYNTSLRPEDYATGASLSPSGFSIARQTASEGEWLQEGWEDTVSETNSFDDISKRPASPRFDWRQRATSRVKKLEVEGEKGNYVRRLKAPVDELDPKSEEYQAFQSYQSKYLKLLKLEEAEDEAALQRRLSTWSVKRLEQEGYCITGLSAYWLQANQFGKPVASFLLGPGEELPDNKLENGTQVLLSRLDPLKEVPASGSVLSRTATHIHVCFANRFDLDGIWRMDLGRPNLMYERMRSAISNFQCNPTATLALNDRDGQVEYIMQGTDLRDVLLKGYRVENDRSEDESVLTDEGDGTTEGTQQDGAAEVAFEEMGAFKEDQRINSWARRYSRPNPIILDSDPPLNLNDSQRMAMAAMIGRRISLIQGPPGTGKTKTIIETIKLLKIHFQVPHPILVCTFTNVAVDNLVEGFVSGGVKPLRVGSNGNIRPALMQHSLDYKLTLHPLHPTFVRLVDEEAQLALRIRTLIKDFAELTVKVKESKRPRKTTLQRAENMAKALTSMEARIKMVKGRAYAIKQQMLKECVDDADVICTTCIASACGALNITDFPVVFLDEASMSTEPASLIPIMKGSQHIALIGDHKQLPPVIVSQKAKEDGLAVSLFERLTEEGHVHSIMLDMQYRMHPEIAHFPAREFYDLALRDGTVDQSGTPLPGLEPPFSRHLQLRARNHPNDKVSEERPSVIFLDHTGNESNKGRSLLNLTEAHLVASVVEDLLLSNKKLLGTDIGIIAPYAAQISLLTRLLNTDANYQKRFQTVLGAHRAMQIPHIEIKTVDGFEGREKEVIIFSTVRNNSTGHIGFLADRKRLNVGLTRAKRGLFVLGSIATLRKGRPMASPSETVSEAMANAKEISKEDQVIMESVIDALPPVPFSGGISVPVKTQTKRTSIAERRAVDRKGNESWQRYAEFMLNRNRVVSLEGDDLRNALYGHWQRLQRTEVLDVERAEMRDSIKL